MICEVHWPDGTVEIVESETAGRAMCRAVWDGRSWQRGRDGEMIIRTAQERVPFHSERADGVLVYAGAEGT